MKIELNYTPGEWRVRTHPTNPEEFFVEAPTPTDDPYYGVTLGTEIMCDGWYPRKRADAAIISTAPNGYQLAQEIVALDLHQPSPDDWKRLWDKAQALLSKAERR